MTKRIKFGELRLNQKSKDLVNDCLNTNQITMGEKVKLFEQKWSELFGYKHTIAVSSGTDAILNAFLCCYDFGAKRGQEIIVPACGFIATSNAVLASGFIPKFVDIKRDTLNLDENLVEQNINKNTVAICAVSTMGKPCNMRKLRELADKYNLLLICDNAEGHGCKYEDKYMEEWADITSYSGYIAHLVMVSEGGWLSTNRDDINEILRSTRTHGRLNGNLKFDHIRFGLNSKMTDISASIGLGQIDEFWDTFNTRRHNLWYMVKRINELTGDKVWLNLEEDNELHCPHALSITLKEDNEVKFNRFYEYMTEAGIEVKLNFRSIPTQQSSFQWMGYKLGDFPEAEFVGRNGLHCACHKYLSFDDVSRIIRTVVEFCKI